MRCTGVPGNLMCFASALEEFNSDALVNITGDMGVVVFAPLFAWISIGNFFQMITAAGGARSCSKKRWRAPFLPQTKKLVNCLRVLHLSRQTVPSISRRDSLNGHGIPRMRNVDPIPVRSLRWSCAW